MIEAHLDKKAALISLIERLEENEGVGRLDALLRLAKPRTERRPIEVVTNCIKPNEEGGSNGTSER